MFKLLALILCFCSFQTFAQDGTRDAKLSRKIDPEVLWFQADSLDAVDTTKVGVDLAGYYELRYDVDKMLYQFDKQEYHLRNCLQWSKAHCFHDSAAIEPLVRALDMCKQLKESLLGESYYITLTHISTENEWSEIQKRRINQAASGLGLIAGYYYNGPIDRENIVELYTCEMDTAVKIHPLSAIEFNQGHREEPKLISGDDNYMEIAIRAYGCRCSDCGFNNRLFIQLEQQHCPESMALTVANTYWSTWNVWRIDPNNKVNYGKFFRNEHGLYLVICYNRDSENQFGYVETLWIAPEDLEGVN